MKKIIFTHNGYDFSSEKRLCRNPLTIRRDIRRALTRKLMRIYRFAIKLNDSVLRIINYRLRLYRYFVFILLVSLHIFVNARIVFLTAKPRVLETSKRFAYFKMFFDDHGSGRTANPTDGGLENDSKSDSKP